MQLEELSSSRVSHRDRIYIIKDLILKLVEYGELNQTALVSFCGLNLKKHRGILEELQERGLVSCDEVQNGKKIITVYRATQRGIEFCQDILEPYEKMFPRKSR